MAKLSEIMEMVSALLEDAERAAGTYADDPDGYHARHRFEVDRVARRLEEEVGARFRDRWDGAAVRISGIRSTSTTGVAGALRNWLKAARRKIAEAQDACSGHVASDDDPKVCGRCGIHIDELRPDDDGDPINLAGSGPVPIEPREG